MTPASPPRGKAAAGRPKKSLGQHFLRDDHYLAGIVAGLEPVPGELVVEIGPGQGALTAPLLAAGLRVTAVELDPDRCDELRDRFGGNPAFSLVQGDARTFDYADLPAPFKVAGNLPYVSAARITVRLLEEAGRWTTMVLTYQREVARRICAGPGSREYGSLSVVAQYGCDVEYLLTIPPGAFWPPPKVHSGVVRFRPRPAPALSPTDKAALLAMVRRVFSHRRKTLLNALAAEAYAPNGREALREELEGWGVDPSRRPETFSLDEFILLGKVLAGGKLVPPPADDGEGWS